MKITVISGSRADWGLLLWPIRLMTRDPFFSVHVLMATRGADTADAIRICEREFAQSKPDAIMLLGDRIETLGAAIAAHLARIPIAHIAGGDITEGSYDDAMRDCISRMAKWHFTTSPAAEKRLLVLGYANVHMVGSPGIDYIRHGNWQKERPMKKPYVIVSYQPETANGANRIEEVLASLPADKHKVLIPPNRDRGSEDILEALESYAAREPTAIIKVIPDNDDFLNWLFHCDEFIGNSSAILYEAPVLGVKTRMVGDRQKGRVVPCGDGRASERIIEVLKHGA